ncbi:aspartic peptidase domain-containing protein [Cercophora scortea]|uniref:Aspartic peptidase domain-containing protein n=1 Tax=Cercophora scortea TaxID=314031 RepID=A0AAE0M6P4_9PEZI|nr:aspartic peptidase domain-containing protein [Cercophora scortea]
MAAFFLPLVLLSSQVHAMPSVGRAVADYVEANRARHTGDGIISIDVARNPNYSPNGLAEYSRALAKWGADAHGPLAGIAANKGQVGALDATPFNGDREYLSPVEFGTPPQRLIMDLDTGSADVWVYSTETEPSDVGSRAIYHPGNSVTAEKINSSTWHIEYGDGSAAYGNVWRDTITIAGVSIFNATIETAVEVSRSIVDDPYMCGVFGLGFSLPSQITPPRPTVLSNMLPLLNSNLFTADLKYQSNGTYTFGHIDSALYTGDTVYYTPLLDNAQYWEFNFTGFNVASTTAGASQDENSIWFLNEWKAIADTGTTLILVDDDIVAKYYSRVPSAHYNDSIAVWTFPCATTDLPDFNIGFAGVHDWSARVPGKFVNYTALPDSYDNSTCMGGIQSNDGLPFAILGDIFLKAVFAVFDVGGKRIGFAPKALVA